MGTCSSSEYVGGASAFALAGDCTVLCDADAGGAGSGERLVNAARACADGDSAYKLACNKVALPPGLTSICSGRVLENSKEGNGMAVKITIRPNGPYRVECGEGEIELLDANGNKYDLTGKRAFSLCRCGGSVNKPFCDGTHSKIGFQAAEAAVSHERPRPVENDPTASSPAKG